jgi:hypothetical protein
VTLALHQAKRPVLAALGVVALAAALSGCGMRAGQSTSQHLSTVSPGASSTSTSTSTAAPTDSSAGSSAGSSDADLLAGIQADLDNADAGTQQADQDLTDGNAAASVDDNG